MVNPIGRVGFFCAGLFAGVLLLAGCATIGASFDSQVRADRIAARTRFIKERISTKPFTLTVYTHIPDLGKPLTVYIEGDGRAWLGPNRISDDPTPAHPMMLELACADASANVAYLARPCQYDNAVLEKPCGPDYWSNKRFSEEVVASMDEAVSALAEKAGASELHLVGYSGGGAVAVLMAARRQDVASLRTIAGNLDPEAVNRFHQAGPLTGSLNPMTVAQKVAFIPQRHFVGTKDTVVPAFVADHFRKAAGGHCLQVTPVEDATHYAGWTERWARLLELPVSCEDPPA